jgi:hypothetical protein
MLRKSIQSMVFKALFKKIMLLYEHSFKILKDLHLYNREEMNKYLIFFGNGTRLCNYFSFLIQISNNISFKV